MNPLLKHYYLASSSTRDLPYKLDKATITNDLSKERPQWILSAYGPGRDAPLQLFGGHPREQSFEELRVRHYELTAQGNQQQAIQEAQAIVNNAEQQIQTVLNDIDGAVKYMINGENEHPNRLDVCKAKGATPNQSQSSMTNQQSTSTFGQPSSSALSQSSAPSAFGRPSVTSFSQLSAPTSTFGKPSAPISTVGQSSAPTFGRPSQPSAFSQASILGPPTASFGQPPSTFGKPAITGPTFGQPSAPSPFGAAQQSAAANNSFGQPLAPTTSSTFGNPSAPSHPSAFGRPSTQNASPAFGQPAISGAPKGFSQTSTAPSNPFAQPIAPPTRGTFSQPSTAAPNSFGQRGTSTANQPVSSFGQPFGPSDTVQPPTGPAANRTDVRSTSGQGANGVQIQKDSQNMITKWKGMPVQYFDDEPCYRGNDGNWQRLWFPDGPPVFTKTVDLPDEAYDEATKANYKHLKETGSFKDGIMPALPPKREWCNWNF